MESKMTEAEFENECYLNIKKHWAKPNPSWPCEWKDFENGDWLQSAIYPTLVWCKCGDGLACLSPELSEETVWFRSADDLEDEALSFEDVVGYYSCIPYKGRKPFEIAVKVKE